MDIHKTFRLSREEEEFLKREMFLEGETNFSTFVRKKLSYSLVELKAEDENRLAEMVAQKTAERLQKQQSNQMLERIYLSLSHIEELSLTSNQVAHEHMKRVMSCFRDLLSEVESTYPLSEEFKNRWL